MKINGSLVFDASSASQIENLRIQKVSSLPSHQGASDVGRLVYNTSDNIIYFGAVSTWVALATGGNAAALQTEVDNIEAALGVFINGDGTLNSTELNSLTNVTGASSLWEALQQIDAAIEGKDTLAELDDVSLSGLSSGNFLRYSGTAWTNANISLSTDLGITTTAATINQLGSATFTAADLDKLSDITASAADINVLQGAAAAGVTPTEVAYLDGLTGNIQTQLNNKQPLDATLTALAGFNSDGILVQTATDTFAARTLVAPAAGITITNADGVSGNPTFALANDLAALEGLTGTGYVVRTGDGTATTRTIDGNTGRIVVTAGDGVASNTNIDLATVTQGNSGSFVKVTLDSYGRVVGNTAVTASDITGLVDSAYVNVTGDTMTGSLTMSGAGVHVILPNQPTAANHAANKAYVDSVAEGLQSKPAVEVIIRNSADITALGAFTYNNGTNGVGATITANANGAFPTIDGVTLTSAAFPDNGVLVAFPNNTANAVYNGRYNLTTVGDINTPWVLTRCGLCDEGSEIPGSYTFVKRGTQYAGSGWVQVQGTDVDAQGDLDVGTDQIWVYQFSGAGSYTAGAGLGISGTEFFINMGAGIVELPGDEVGIHLYSPSSGAIILTENGTARSSATGAMLHLLLPSGSGLTQDSTGLYIPANGITNAMLLNEYITINADAGGTDNVDLGETLNFYGTSTQGINTSRSADNTITISAADASATQKGVAKFDATEFTVTSGNVVLGTVPLAKLAASSITITGTSGSDAVALGETLSIVGGAGVVSTAVTANTVTISVQEATTSLKGVASFNSNFFSVSSGEVSLAATLDDLTNVSGADTAATGDILTKTATTWQPISRTTLAGSINLGDLQDVGTATPTDGHVLVGNGTSWNNQKVYHLHDQASAATTWSVTHNLGQQYCNVTVVDDTDNVVIPQSIVFTNSNTLTVTFNTAISGKVVVMGIA